MKIEKLRRLKGKSLFNGAAVFHHVALALTEPIKPIGSQYLCSYCESMMNNK